MVLCNLFCILILRNCSHSFFQGVFESLTGNATWVIVLYSLCLLMFVLRTCVLAARRSQPSVQSRVGVSIWAVSGCLRFRPAVRFVASVSLDDRWLECSVVQGQYLCRFSTGFSTGFSSHFSRRIGVHPSWSAAAQTQSLPGSSERCVRRRLPWRFAPKTSRKL